jgi:hypothetical protein
MSDLHVDSQPYDALTALYAHNPKLADAVDEVLDWLEAEPVHAHAKRRRFADGMWVVSVIRAGGDWTLLWEEQSGTIYVRALVETTSI